MRIPHAKRTTAWDYLHQAGHSYNCHSRMLLFADWRNLKCYAAKNSRGGERRNVMDVTARSLMRYQRNLSGDVRLIVHFIAQTNGRRKMRTTSL